MPLPSGILLRPSASSRRRSRRLAPASARGALRSALGLALAVAVTGCSGGWDAGDPSSIEREDVERVLGTLAADSMRGRSAFSPDAMRAAEYIATEFGAAALEPMEGLDGYLQEFDLRQLSAGPATLSLNGSELDPGAYALRLGAESIDWSSGDVPVQVVGPDVEQLEGSLGAVLNAGEDAVVFLHPSHAALFQQLVDFLGRPQRVMSGEPATTLVVVLTDAGADADWSLTAEASVDSQRLANVVGVVPGRRLDEIVLFSAHYDHIGVRPGAEGDSIANGANDNASGVSAVVALADYFAGRGTPERTLVFVGFTAEEGGGHGSRYFSEQLDPDQIGAMFNIEMIGKPAVEGPNSAWITGFDRSTFGPLLQEAVQGTVFSFHPDPYPDQNLFYRSDNATLARLGVPAHSISTTPIDVDPDYHQVSDHIETLDLEHTTNAVRAIATGAERFVTGEATPTRVDPATVDGR